MISVTMSKSMTCKEILCDADNLYGAYLVSIKGSKWKESTQRFMLHFMRYIFLLKANLENQTLVNGKPNEFFLSERGHIRPITSIPLQDRIVRHDLVDNLLMPEVGKHIIYDNGASIKGRGIEFQRKRFEVHLRRYYKKHGNEGYILFGDFSKFYDNIVHETAKRQFLDLFDDDEFLDWLLTVIFEAFRIDVSYMSDEEFVECMNGVFDKASYRRIPKSELAGKKWLEKSVNIGDQLSQVIGIFYPNRIDTYIKHVKSQKFYGRYMDDFYIMSPSKEELESMLDDIRDICRELGIHLNEKKTKIVRMDKPFRFLQIRYTLTTDGKIHKRINPKRVTAMRRRLKKLAVKANNNEINYENVENTFKGWMGNFYKIMSRKQRQNMISLYEELFDKSVTIINKKMVITDKTDAEAA